MYNVLKYLLPELFDEGKAFRHGGGLPKVTRFQILMILATTWAFIFAQMTMTFLHFGVTVTTSVIAHALIIGGIIFTRKSLNGVDYKFDSYHSVGRQRGYTWARDKQGNPYKVSLDPNDPGGEHE
jgi:hypothetical protein